jgi:hypothetical protein
MKIAIFAFLMVIVLTLVESYSSGDGGMSGGGSGVFGPGVGRRGKARKDTVDGMRLKRDLNNKVVQRDLGNGQSRYIRDVNKKHHVHMSYERVPAARVARNAHTLKNVHERAFAETEDAGK